jgi:hypothetical protein
MALVSYSGDETGEEIETNERVVIKVQQNVQKPNNMTVFGSAQLEMKVDDSVGRNFKGRAIFDVTSATA